MQNKRKTQDRQLRQCKQQVSVTIAIAVKRGDTFLFGFEAHWMAWDKIHTHPPSCLVPTGQLELLRTGKKTCENFAPPGTSCICHQGCGRHQQQPPSKDILAFGGLASNSFNSQEIQRQNGICWQIRKCGEAGGAVIYIPLYPAAVTTDHCLFYCILNIL